MSLSRLTSSAQTPLSLLTLAVAACLRHPDREAAFKRATSYMGRNMEDMYHAGRAGCIYALLAASCGEMAVAHEELAFVRMGNTRTNLQARHFKTHGTSRIVSLFIT